MPLIWPSGRAIGPPSSLEVAISTAIGWMKRVDETGSVAPGQMGWKTMTFLAALRHDRIDAPWFIEGPIMA